MRKKVKGITLFFCGIFLSSSIFLSLKIPAQVANVKFRIIAANPSSLRKQRVPIKVYLPTEVRPQDVIDSAGLELEFDPDKSCYYAYGSLMLEPSQIRVFNVEVDDIWFIPAEDLASVEGRVRYLMKAFENTEFLVKMDNIAHRAGLLIAEITKTQRDDKISSSQHIGVHRTNTKALALLKEEIDEMEKILKQAGGPLTPKMLTDTKFSTESPTKTATWIVIFIILIFLGLLSVVIFFTWYRQAKATDKILTDAKKSVFRDFKDKET